jgi:hypothetical protein
LACPVTSNSFEFGARRRVDGLALARGSQRGLLRRRPLGRHAQALRAGFERLLGKADEACHRLGGDRARVGRGRVAAGQHEDGARRKPLQVQMRIERLERSGCSLGARGNDAFGVADLVDADDLHAVLLRRGC